MLVLAVSCHPFHGENVSPALLLQECWCLLIVSLIIVQEVVSVGNVLSSL